MSIEQALADLKAAVEANTAALLGQGSTGKTSTATADKPAATGKGKGGAAKAKGATREEMVAALGKLKNDFEADAAKEVIKEAGGVVKMADIPDDKVDAVFKAAVAKHEELSAGGGSDDDDDGI